MIHPVPLYNFLQKKMVFPSFTKKAFFLPAIALTLSIASCAPKPKPPAPEGTTTPPTSTNAPPPAAGPTISLSGAGATFPAPLYQDWFASYNKLHPNVQISYQSSGSGAGVEQVIKGTVDFGASDVAMKDEEIAKVPKDKGVVLLPMTAGSIVIAYNIPDVSAGLKLSRAVYTDIFSGKITKWNDPKIVAANPELKLPVLPITVVHRADGSGTTAVFTKHLSAISPEWKSSIGDGKTVEWPKNDGFVGAKGNEGITTLLKQTKGTISYTEYGYAKQNQLNMAVLENKAGKYVEATPESGAKTLASVQLPENLRAFISDPEGDASYPIVTYTWILAYQKYDKPDTAKALKDVLNWALTDGQKSSPDKGYIPLPPEVVTKVKTAVDSIKP